MLTKHGGKMILVDATYIHNGGTRVLLDYLIEQFQENNVDAFYLVDDRIPAGDLPSHVQFKTITGLKYLQRHNFMLQNRKKFRRVLCFNNIPPSVRMGCEVITYVQSPFYFYQRGDFDVSFLFSYFLKRKLFRFTRKFTDTWVVQTHLMRKELNEIYHVDTNQVFVWPFFRPASILPSGKKVKGTFLYASNALAHKNHHLLIEAFCRFYDTMQTGRLVLTVSKSYGPLWQIISEKQSQGYPIDNIGFVAKEVLEQWYDKAEFYIHPALEESLGLGLIEAVAFGCKVLGADLPYTYEVCSPSAVFNPYDVNALVRVFEKAVTTTLPETTLSISDKLDELIGYLKR